MGRLGVISDGISRDLGHALRVARDAGLDEIELQFVGDREVGDFDEDETARVVSLVREARMPVSCVSRHVFGGLLVRETEPGSDEHRAQLDKLASCIDLAHRLDCDVVRIMSGRREMILFGEDGADQWNVAHGAWEGLKGLVRPAVEMAERERVTLVVETGNGGTICSARLGRRLVDEIGSERLKVLWDPANCMFANEPPAPLGIEALGGGAALGHLHVKDVVADMPAAHRSCVRARGRPVGVFAPADGGLVRSHRLHGRHLPRSGLPPGGRHLRGRVSRLRRALSRDLRLARLRLGPTRPVESRTGSFEPSRHRFPGAAAYLPASKPLCKLDSSVAGHGISRSRARCPHREISPYMAAGWLGQALTPSCIAACRSRMIRSSR